MKPIALTDHPPVHADDWADHHDEVAYSSEHPYAGELKRHGSPLKAAGAMGVTVAAFKRRLAREQGS